MARYFLQGTGQTCYSRTGVTWPERLELDWESLVDCYPGEGREMKWQQGPLSLPEVLTFEATQREAEEIVDRIDRVCRANGLRDTGFVATLWWEDEVPPDTLLTVPDGRHPGLIPPGYYGRNGLVALLRTHADNPDAIRFIADMLER